MHMAARGREVVEWHGSWLLGQAAAPRARCRLKAWELDEKDRKTLEEYKEDAFLVLESMPKILFLEMLSPMKEQYPGLPNQWFPMRPVETYWTLDADENIEIARRGFPLVPNFSTTIDGATGQTLKSSIADLGDFGSSGSYPSAMRGYIALSRVTAGDNMLIARSFNPFLFKLGCEPFPSLLFRTLSGEFDIIGRIIGNIFFEIPLGWS